MTEHVTPGEVVEDAKPLRRKLHVWEGEERGCQIHRGYGWCSLWDGKASYASHYA